MIESTDVIFSNWSKKDALVKSLTRSPFLSSVLQLHILPREIFVTSTFGLSMWLLKWFPITVVDGLLLFFSWLILGNTERYGLKRPKTGPLQLKNKTGKTPVLDVGTLAKIKNGQIKVSKPFIILYHFTV